MLLNNKKLEKKIIFLILSQTSTMQKLQPKRRDKRMPQFLPSFNCEWCGELKDEVCETFYILLAAHTTRLFFSSLPSFFFSSKNHII